LLAEFNITVRNCCFYDMAADKMSSEHQAWDYIFQNYFLWFG